MKRTFALVLALGASFVLSGCVTPAMLKNSADNSGNWVPTLQQIQAAETFKRGVTTVADVETTYGQPCIKLDDALKQASVKAVTCTIVLGTPAQPKTMLMYNITSDWSPSCFTDPSGCETVTQSTMTFLTYTFGADGLLETISSKTSCTAYVGEYHFDNGCIDHD